MKNIRVFYLNIFQFLEVKFSIYLNRRVFVKVWPCGYSLLGFFMFYHVRCLIVVFSEPYEGRSFNCITNDPPYRVAVRSTWKLRDFTRRVVGW